MFKRMWMLDKASVSESIEQGPLAKQRFPEKYRPFLQHRVPLLPIQDNLQDVFWSETVCLAHNSHKTFSLMGHTRRRAEYGFGEYGFKHRAQ